MGSCPRCVLPQMFKDKIISWDSGGGSFQISMHYNVFEGVMAQRTL